ncbi:MAG: leucine-rich repeat domain-containing protein [Clostridia bacterium]|nr:leucine-rich repeat domain-containing protein [Clostridia bacterium]
MKLKILPLLVLCMLIFTLSAGAETVTGTCGKQLTWSLDLSTGAMTISGTGSMGVFSEAPWAEYTGSIRTLVIADGPASVSGYAFSGCTALEEITLSSTVISVGSSAFAGCTALKTVILHGTDTVFGFSAFADCNNLQDIRVDSLGQYLGYEHAVSGLYLHQPGIITVDGAPLMQLVIPQGITAIDARAFCNCTGITSVSFPDDMTALGNYAFAGCTALKQVTIPCAMGDGVFSDCTGLTDVTITDNVTAIGKRAFQGCTALTAVTIPDSVTAIGNSAFYGCSGLQSVIIPSKDITFGLTVFGQCNQVQLQVLCGSTAWQYAQSGRISYRLSGHAVYLEQSQTPPTCGEDGHQQHYACPSCGTLFIKSGDTMTETDADALRIPRTRRHHLEGSVCRDCGRTFAVDGKPCITIPKGITLLGSDALLNCGAAVVVIENNSITIEENALASPDLTAVFLPAALEKNEADWFGTAAPEIIYR